MNNPDHNCCYSSVAHGSMCGASAGCAVATPTTLALGRGLRVSGCNAEVDLCGLAETVAQRTPGAAATILFCDEQGLGKVALSTLLAGLAPAPAPAPVYRLEAAVGGAITLKKDGVAVDTYQLCTLVAPCTTAGGGGGGGTLPVYHIAIEGNRIKLVKDGVAVDNLPIPCTCEGGGGTSNTPPVAVNNAYTTQQGVSLTITDLLANDSDADGNTLAIGSVGVPTSGTATVVNSTTVQYVPAAGFVGIATFNYTITDANGGVATAQVTVTVTSSGGGGSNLL